MIYKNSIIKPFYLLRPIGGSIWISCNWKVTNEWSLRHSNILIGSFPRQNLSWYRPVLKKGGCQARCTNEIFYSLQSNKFWEKLSFETREWLFGIFQYSSGQIPRREGEIVGRMFMWETDWGGGSTEQLGSILLSDLAVYIWPSIWHLGFVVSSTYAGYVFASVVAWHCNKLSWKLLQKRLIPYQCRSQVSVVGRVL